MFASLFRHDQLGEASCLKTVKKRGFSVGKRLLSSGDDKTMGILFTWIIITIAIFVAAYLIPGIKVDSIGAAIVGAAVLGVLNALIKPVLIILTLPITLLTLGLFIFVINALLFWLAGSIIPGFRVNSFGSALLGSLVVTIVSYIARAL